MSKRKCPACGRVETTKASAAAIRKAERSYRNFHWGEAPTELVDADAPCIEPGEVVISLGELVQVTYEASKGGELAHWYHPFKAPRPVLAYTQRGHLVIVGGGYKVTPRGIVG